jgi:hypothetical protein
MFAQLPGKGGMLQSPEFLVTVGLLMAALLAGAAAIYVTDLWRKKRERQTAEGIESLSMYREMFEDGELSEPEYRVIRDRLARQMKAGLRPELGAGAVGANVAAPDAAGSPPPGPPGPIP